MTLVSVTRLRLRSVLFLLPFMYYASASTRQAQKSAGCRGATTRKTQGLTFWTLTAWDDERSMRSFVAAPPHRNAIPKLARWCDEGSVAHWSSDQPGLPDWARATSALQEKGRLLRVAFPSEVQSSGRINVT